FVFAPRASDISSSRIRVAVRRLCPARTLDEVFGQRQSEIRVRPQLDVIDLMEPAASLKFAAEGVELMQLAVADTDGVGQQVRQLLEAVEERRLPEWELDFRAVEHVEYHHVMPLILQVLEPGEDLARFVEKIAEDRDHTTAAEPVGRVVKHRPDLRLPVRRSA